MTRQRFEITGMTCDHCAVKVEAVLEDAGAQGVFVDYRRGFAEFEAAGVDFAQARAVLRDTSYELGSRFRSRATAARTRSRRSRAGSRASSSTTWRSSGRVRRRSRRRSGFRAGRKGGDCRAGHTVGGTCVNIGCVPSKAMLRAGETYSSARRNPHRGAPTSAGPVDLATLVAQKDALARRCAGKSTAT